MKPNEFELQIVEAINSAIKAQIHPSIIFMVLHSHASNIIQMVKDQPRNPPEGGEVVEVGVR